MPRMVAVLLAAATGAAAAWPFAASSQTLVAHVGPGSGSPTQICSPPAGSASGATTQTYSAACFGQFNFPGSATGSAIAATGHLGGVSEAFSDNADSLVASNTTDSLFQDFLVFHAAAPGATSEDVAANVVLDGLLQAGGAIAGAHVEATVILGSALFKLAYDLDQNLVLSGSNEFVIDAGTPGAVMGLHLHTPFVTVPLDSPVLFRLDLQTAAGASGALSHAKSEFFAHSFKLPSAGPAFRLGDGVTVNAADYLLDNRFIDPLAGSRGVPEPASWALLIAGFGLAGAALRARRALA